MENLTLSLAVEVAPRKVRVNAVAPGHTESEGTAAMVLFAGEAGRGWRGTPRGPLGTPDDIAPFFLASDSVALDHRRDHPGVRRAEVSGQPGP